MMGDNQDDLFVQDDGGPSPVRRPPWPILVVDDDEQVHAMTRVLLRDFVFEDRPFAMVSAYSAAEAREILARRPDLPVVLLDVVMETQDAGLLLVHHIRRELGNRHIRIILRTGQPGQAPERDVIVAYDINDYKSKSDLTAQHLFTCLVSALRSWRDIETIEILNQSLEKRVQERTAELMRQKALAEEQRLFIENLVEMLPSPVWYKDSGGRTMLCNRAFRDLFCVVPACGDSGVEMDSSVLLVDRDEPPPDGPDPVVFEASLTDPFGASRELLVVKKALPDEGGVIGIATDITERRRMERELHRLAITDPLSGVHNRRHLLSTLEQAVRDAPRSVEPVSLIMLDIDRFKSINDDYGHAAGDCAIKAVVAELRRHMRNSDGIGRIGGEEFAILLPGTSLDVAARIADRLRTGVAGTNVSLPDGRTLRVTASFGITEVRREHDTTEAVLHRADQALYRAKANGRNRIELS